MLKLLALALALCAAPSEGREKVNFDFAWRFKLNEHTPGPPPGPPHPPSPPLPPPSPHPPANRLATCDHCKNGTNYGTGSISTIHTGTYQDCCTACAAQPLCKAWDWNGNAGGQCYLKDNSNTSTFEDRWSGIMPSTANAVSHPHPPAPPAPAPPSPESQPGYDDSAWLVVDAPHDMLIDQTYDPANTKQMGYLPRGSGWYRKHFTLPAEWEGKAVWLYIEGAFHTTTAYLNGVKMGYHQAGYTSFWLRFDNVTGVKYGGAENVLALSLDATFGTGWWYEGGGLIRHNYLVSTETTHLQPDSTWSFATDIVGVANTQDTTTPTAATAATPSSSVSAAVGHYSAKSATVVTSAEVTNHGAASSSVTIKATITDAATGTIAGSSTSDAITVPAGETVVAKTSKQLSDVNVWSVQSPSLYTVSVDVLSSSSPGKVLDTFNYSIGIRTLAFDTKGLHLNGDNVKVRGFCDHSNFGGVGGAVPDRVNLYRTQMLRSVGANSWRMAHNPPIPARLDFMDRLGMLALDENRDYGDVGDRDNEPLPVQLTDMRDLVKRDRSHPSVMAWSFCNEGECNVDQDAKPFRNVTYEFDGTRPVTQNYVDTGVDVQSLDIQGFSHKSGKEFDTYHASHPGKPMMATECCSCMSQRGVDQDACPSPADGGCDGGKAAGLGPGVFYNNNIGQCTAQQVLASDSRDFVAGTYIWSGFDYYGEARGFPQNTKCRGTVSDIAGFFKETSYWIRSWWLSNIPDTDAGKPPLSWKPDVPTPKTTVFILETWQPAPAVYANKLNHSRTINVYTNAPGVRLELNGKAVTAVQKVEFFGQATFDKVPFSPGNLTAVAVDAHNTMLASHTVVTPTMQTGSIELSLDAPSVATGTGTHVVADGEDVALVRVTLLDSAGNFAADASDNVTFTIVSGPGRIWTTHNGDPADGSPRNATWNTAYHGLVRVFVRTTTDSATPLWHRQRMLQIDLDSGVGNSANVDGAAQPESADIVIKAEIVGASNIAPATLTIPVSNDLTHLPMAVAAKSV